MSTHAERLRLRREAKKLTEEGDETIDLAEEILKEVKAIRMLLVQMNRRDALRAGEEV